MTYFARAAAIALVGSTMLLARPAAAQPATANSIQLGAGFRYGFDFEEGDVNPWATGLGIDLGYTLSNAVFVGGSFEYFFGSSVEEAGLEASANLWQAMAEGGYDVGLGDNLVIRPKVEAGIAGVSTELCPVGGSCNEDSETAFALAPGGTFLLLTTNFSLSLDARYELVFAEGETLNGLILSIGIGF